MAKRQRSGRSVRTVYYFRREVVKVNKSSHANRAVLHCVNHMQLNSYEATEAEVYDEETGVLHCVVRRSVTGTITIVYKREVKEEY